MNTGFAAFAIPSHWWAGIAANLMFIAAAGVLFFLAYNIYTQARKIADLEEKPTISLYAKYAIAMEITGGIGILLVQVLVNLYSF